MIKAADAAEIICLAANANSFVILRNIFLFPVFRIN